MEYTRIISFNQPNERSLHLMIYYFDKRFRYNCENVPIYGVMSSFSNIVPYNDIGEERNVFWDVKENKNLVFHHRPDFIRDAQSEIRYLRKLADYNSIVIDTCHK